MVTVGEHIRATDEVICHNITLLADQRDLLSQNVLAQLRNLVEGAAVRLHLGTSNADYSYPAIEQGLDFINSKGQFRFLARFHRMLKVSASHYTVDGDASERLMLKYYEHLLRLRALLAKDCGIAALANLESFPIDLDPSLREYHEKIAARISEVRAAAPSGLMRQRFYIHKTRPFFVAGRIYYEVTFYRAVNRVSKFDRVIGFTDIDISDHYSAMLTLHPDSIDVLDQTMPITIIQDWQVSIRPCEIENFARILGMSVRAGATSPEFVSLMAGLTWGSRNLLDIIDMTDERYEEVRAACTSKTTDPQIFPVLDEARRLLRSSAAGHNVIRYLLLRMNNQVIKSQYYWEGCGPLSGLNLSYGCIPFDTMPFCSSLVRHNPRYWDLVESLDETGRAHELLARRVRNNVERHGTLYTPAADLAGFGDLASLLAAHNGRLYYKHTARQLSQDMGHVFIRGYEDETVAILEQLRAFTSSGIEGYSAAVNRWLDESPGIDDDVKKDALSRLFSESKVALIYGAAGTGKSTMVDHIARYFNDKAKLFLAHTNPAKGNLERRVTAQNATFRTISSHLRQSEDTEYDLLIIDECSTVSNADLLKVLEQTRFKLLVLVGDVYQIESIQFGNWFGIVRSFVPGSAVFELTTPFRTKNASLLGFWNKVRNLDDDIAEAIAHNGYSTVLDKHLFEPQGRDEIILCLNYDGLYGINNVNRFLQGTNPSPAVSWREATYKVGDPILFNESDRFRPLIYNNLKGRITGIEHSVDRIRFEVELDRPVSEFDVVWGLEWVGGSRVAFSVLDYDVSDEDDDALDTTVPFQVAYAVSIHKAQGLEYDSVKIVITDANEDDLTHSIFYTAVTRSRESLRIFWTPETQQAVLKSLRRDGSRKDVALLSSRRGIAPTR